MQRRFEKKRSKECVSGQGRPELCPHSDAVVQWVKEMRRENFPLKTGHVVIFLEEAFTEWTKTYKVSRKPKSLQRLVQRIVLRHGFSFRRPSRTLLTTVELEEQQRLYSATVGASVRRVYPCHAIFNADETGVYYDKDVGPIIADKGAKSNAKVLGRKHSCHASVLLVVSVAGDKLRPLIIFKAQPGGTVEAECISLPKEAVYAVQESGWMDAPTWKAGFVDGLWSHYISDTYRDALALYLDNLKCHVSETSVRLLANYGTEMVPLPKNTTSVLQPLDVGLMGPFKRRLRSLLQHADISNTTQWTLRERLLAKINRPACEKRRAIAERVIAAWEGTSREAIISAWAKAGL